MRRAATTLVVLVALVIFGCIGTTTPGDSAVNAMDTPSIVQFRGGFIAY